MSNRIGFSVCFALLAVLAARKPALPNSSAASLPHSQQSFGAGSLTPPVAHPRNWVVVKEGTPYVVPNDATFLATAVGTSGSGAFALGTALLDGGPFVKSVGGTSGTGPGSMLSVGPLVSAPGGSTLSVSSSALDGRLWGYLFRNSDPVSGGFTISSPSEWITIHEGAPYQVPAGKLLVATTISFANAGTLGSCWVKVDGQREYTAFRTASKDSNARELPVGMALAAGSVVEPIDQDGAPPKTGVLWGFLVDA